MVFQPRFSIWLLMALVLMIAVILGLAIPAVDVYRTKEPHAHQGIDMSGTPTLAGWSGIQPPFWPRYGDFAFPRVLSRTMPYSWP